MRLLFVHDGSPAALDVQRALASQVQLQLCGSLAQAVRELSIGRSVPDIMIVDLPEQGVDQAMLNCARKLLGDAPIVLGASSAELFVRAVGGPPAPPPPRPRSERARELTATIEMLVEQQRLLSQEILAQRTQLLAEVDRFAREAAEAAAAKAVEQLATKLGLDDGEGLRLAIRFARAWEEAKSRFVSAVTTGLASAFLLALGAGVIAMVKNTSPK